jgi:hypothetical protein
MSGNLGGFRSSGRSTAARDRRPATDNPAGFAALLTFPGMGFLEKPLLATRGYELYKVVAGINPATDATQVLRTS